MEPIISREGQVVGWLKRDVVYDEAGQPRAFIRGNSVFALDAQYLGRLAHGFFRDVHGDAVAFMKDASGGPVTPTPNVIPEPPHTWEVRALAEPRVVATAATPSLFWSEVDWTTFINPAPLQDLPSTATLNFEGA